MELSEAMRTTGTCRYFTTDPVPDDVLHEAFDLARFGPQGGNRQPVRWIVVRDPDRRRTLAELYLPLWKTYLEGLSGGSVRTGALPRTVADIDHFAEHLADVPVIVVVCAELSALHATDRDLDRLSVVGGASIYPVVQNFCLALRSLGLGSAVTTMLCRHEAEIRELLAIPDRFVTAAHVAVGHPARPFPRRLSRTAVAETVWAETFGNPLFTP